MTTAREIIEAGSRDVAALMERGFSIALDEADYDALSRAALLAALAKMEDTPVCVMTVNGSLYWPDMIRALRAEIEAEQT